GKRYAPSGRADGASGNADGGPDRIRTGDLQRDRLACWAATPRVQLRRGRSIPEVSGVVVAGSARRLAPRATLYSAPMARIDLRSDTVTKPSPAMRRAMAEAEVGDDVYLEDPTVNRLQSRAAEIFGREAGLFVPSGSMGNLACIMAQTSRGQEVICEAAGHIYNYEMGSMTALGGVLPRLVAAANGILTWDKIAPAIREKVYYRPQTTLISLENTHNMAGGTVYPTDVAEEICDRAHEAGISVHLDGARIFNAAVYLRQDVAAITKKFDSVQFCLSKGLGAPVGSMIVGSRDFIERCRAIRKMLGGGMRQVGVLAGAGLVALEEG